MVALNQIPGIVLIFGIIVVFGVVMSTLVADLKSDECQTLNATVPGQCVDSGNNTALSEAFNFSNNGEQGFINIAGKLPLLGTIVILAAVITVVITVFRFKGQSF